MLGFESDLVLFRRRRISRWVSVRRECSVWNSLFVIVLGTNERRKRILEYLNLCACVIEIFECGNFSIGGTEKWSW